MRVLSKALVAAVSLFAASVAGAQAPTSSATSGYLDFIGSKAGAPKVTGTNIATGPYDAKFGTSASNAATKSAFDVYCFDWMANTGDGNVVILTFNDLINQNGAVATALYSKMTSSSAVSGSLSLSTLNSAAWLVASMSAGTQSLWDEKHVALWNLFWNDGAGSPGLPGEGNYNGISNPSNTNGALYWYNQALANGSYDASSYRIFAPVDNQGNFVTDRQVFMGQVTQVPEPASFALVAMGLVGLGVARRRTKQ
ncbi:MAG: PEP-CTERM sorting domain-containing protein [Gemmatimonadaceae bacterium]|nr:PEP-CTERM sorting domain-containing protein [Gemmatimonadaceae bacterium]